MNEVKILEENKKITSLEVAKMVGREHSDVLKDLRRIKSHLAEGTFPLSDYFTNSLYKDSTGRTLPSFLLTKKGCELYATRMTGEKGTQFAVKYIERFNEMEQQLAQPKLPTTYKEALLALVEEVERSEQLQLDNQIKDQQIAEMQPKVTYVDMVLQCTDLLTTTQIADDYGMSAQRFNKLLHEQGIQYKQSGQWLLYAKYKGEGYTKSDTIPYKRTDGSEGVSILTKWTQKGRLFLYETLKVNDILPTMEQIKLTLIEKQELEVSTPERMN